MVSPTIAVDLKSYVCAAHLLESHSVPLLGMFVLSAELVFVSGAH